MQVIPARPATFAPWPEWVPASVISALNIPGLWEHQATAASLAHAGDSVIVATGTASGKSLAYLLPSLTAAFSDEATLYLAPTKALAHDQLRSVESLDLASVRAATFDGDTPPDARDWIRRHANFVLTNPDMLHYGILPGHARWSSFLRRLRYVIIDESHGYRGVFGSHVAQIIRRLRRVCARYGTSPTFILASATVSAPAVSATTLTGLPMTAVTTDASPRGATTFALWEPPLLDAVSHLPLPPREHTAPSLHAPSLHAPSLHAPSLHESPHTTATNDASAASAAGSASDPSGQGLDANPSGRSIETNRSGPHVPEPALDETAPPRVDGVETHQAEAEPHRFSEDSGPAVDAADPLRTDDVPGRVVDETALRPASKGRRPPAEDAKTRRSDRDARHAEAEAFEWDGKAGEVSVRRAATSEVADLLADLVVMGAQTLAFVRSRRGVENVSLAAKRGLEEVSPGLETQVAAYRGGYLPEERRALEGALRSRELLGLATTNALELGIDVSGLDAVLICGWPGTRASLWQQAGRAGRSGQDALAVLVARDDPLDTYLVHHPSAIFGTPVEATVLDPDNPYVLEPHLCAAAAELPLTADDFTMFGPTSAQLVDNLVSAGQLRRRPTGWFWTHRERPKADLRGSGSMPVQVVEAGTGRLLGTVDEGSAHSTVHEGAVYVHQGESFLVELLDLEDSVALVSQAYPDYTTSARSVTEIHILDVQKSSFWGESGLHFGTVEVKRQVVAYQMRRNGSGEVIGEKPLDLPESALRTKSVWWTISPDAFDSLGDFDAPGAAHAAEHASIGLLPLFATCDRWDIGGVSTQLHPDTGLLTVFVYDGHPGGAGFAERAYSAAHPWLLATYEAIASCDCDHGCPSCIQSPKCGNGNDPLNKRDALALLSVLLHDHPPTPPLGPASLGPTGADQ
ncbi:hypothetical protein GCM10010468_35040 [Actinocorallia longicatena]|uniref:DEAD/DEAH box helicase domain-containing protein n=1 Tax=Actinocorallia longicatena TaxID=111803 RepID=A0ABP6QDC2_9ACTN